VDPGCGSLVRIDPRGYARETRAAQLDDPQLVRLYRLGSETLETDAGDDSRLLDLMRERGWASWTKTRPERLAEPPG
jgi:hypothetical protein